VSELLRALRELGWRSLFSLLVTAGLTATSARWAAAVLRGDTSPSTLVMLVVMVGGAAYFWRHVQGDLLPRLTLELRFNRAWQESDWVNVKAELESAFSRGWISDEWRASLALANQRLGSREDAIELYDQIESPLPSEELEYARLFNHSLCLLDLGRLDEARSLFASVPLVEWPEPMQSHVEEHRRRLRGGGS